MLSGWFGLRMYGACHGRLLQRPSPPLRIMCALKCAPRILRRRCRWLDEPTKAILAVDLGVDGRMLFTCHPPQYRHLTHADVCPLRPAPPLPLPPPPRPLPGGRRRTVPKLLGLPVCSNDMGNDIQEHKPAFGCPPVNAGATAAPGAVVFSQGCCQTSGGALPLQIDGMSATALAELWKFHIQKYAGADNQTSDHVALMAPPAPAIWPALPHCTALLPLSSGESLGTGGRGHEELWLFFLQRYSSR